MSPSTPSDPGIYWYETQYVEALARQSPETYAAEYRRRSELVAAGTDGRFDLAYGAHARQRLDVFLPAKCRATPLILFFHGGYWRSNSRDSRRFLAEQWVEAGVAFAVADYRIAPHGRLEDMVADACDAFRMLHGEAEALGIDGGAILVSGNSAGAHLAAMVASRVQGAVAPLGTCLLSGLYDLRPLLQTSIAAEVGLTRAEACTCSPLLAAPAAAPAALFVGGDESDAFRAQSEAFAWQRLASGLEASCTVLEGHDHFSIIAELGRPEGPIGKVVSAMLGRDHG